MIFDFFRKKQPSPEKFPPEDPDLIIRDHVLIHWDKEDSVFAVPDTVKRIDQFTFSSNEFLRSVRIPDIVTEIGESAFFNCKNLEEVLLPDSLTVIPDGLCNQCKNLKFIKIPEHIIRIEASAFFRCQNLESFTFPASLKSIEKYAFHNCGLHDLTLPEGLTKIEEGAFSDCEHLKSVILPDSVEEIGEYAFLECTGLESLSFPASLEEIPRAVCCECCNLKHIRISEHTSIIGEAAFSGCALQSVEIPDSVKEIGSRAFDCDSMKSFTRYGIIIKIENSTEIDELLKQAVYLRNPDDEKACAYLEKNSEILFRIDPEYFKKFLNSGKVFTKENIDQAILKANQKQLYQHQILLTNYKYQHFDFDQAGENLKL